MQKVNRIKESFRGTCAPNVYAHTSVPRPTNAELSLGAETRNVRAADPRNPSALMRQLSNVLGETEGEIIKVDHRIIHIMLDDNLQLYVHGEYTTASPAHMCPHCYSITEVSRFASPNSGDETKECETADFLLTSGR